MTRMRTLAGGLVLLFCFCFSGCAVEELDEIVVVADVKDEFYLDVWEALTPTARNLQLHISTIEQEDCKNAYIDHRFKKSGNGFTISLRDIRQPDHCDPGRSPARTNIDMGSLNPGFYSFTIDLKNTVFNEGQLTALNDRYLIRLETENGVKLARQELFRVPDAVIWGYVHYRSSDDEAGALAFMEEVKKLGEPVSFKKGYYGYFTVGAGSMVESIYDQPADGTVKPFLFQYRGDDASLQQLVTRYRTTYSAQIDFRLFNSKGQTF